MFNVFSKRVIEHRLVIPPTLFLNFRTEPIDNISVESDRYPNFIPRLREHGTTLAFAEIIFRFHIVLPHYAQLYVLK